MAKENPKCTFQLYATINHKVPNRIGYQSFSSYHRFPQLKRHTTVALGHNVLQDIREGIPFLAHTSNLAGPFWGFFVPQIFPRDSMFSSPRLVKGLVETELVQPAYNLIYMAASV